MKRRLPGLGAGFVQGDFSRIKQKRNVKKMSYSDDFDTPEFYTKTRPKAKKEHCCCECKKTINVGDEYVRITGKWDGVCRTYKTCLHCENLRHLMYKKFDINCGYEYLYMDMQDGEITEEDLLAK